MKCMMCGRIDLVHCALRFARLWSSTVR